ncbi:MAG: hypothetical protein E4G96_01765 [Chrysiogenales bacterium]|nr:MAG: hypothetical protein E4G96_01765 [Chrysiogenales bacterium]
MKSILVWIYLLNVVFLILHEIDGAYWKEWRFFGTFGRSLSDRSGLSVYLYAHIPIFTVLLYGLVSLELLQGRIISLFFSGFMICHFFLHLLFKMKGHEGFDSPVSKLIFSGTLALSIIQLAATLRVMGE